MTTIMDKGRIVQLRKKGGINSIEVDKHGRKLSNIALYHQDIKDREGEGEPMGEYRGKSLLDAKHFISPMWSDLKKQWSWGGTPEDLARIIVKMKLRYPKDHPKEKKVIEPGNRVEDRLTDRSDDVFNHPSLYARFYMENNRISLNLNDPLQEFLYFCYKGDHSVLDHGDGGVKNKYIAGSAKYELVSTKRQNQQKKIDASREIKAVTLLAALDGDEEKIRAICEVMELPGYGRNTDVTGAWLLVKEMGAQNTTMSSKYGKTYQDKFIELAEMSDEELRVVHQIMSAKARGHIRKRDGYVLFDGDRIDGLRSDSSIINYFRSPENQDRYIKLVELLENASL